MVVLFPLLAWLLLFGIAPLVLDVGVGVALVFVPVLWCLGWLAVVEHAPGRSAVDHGFSRRPADFPDEPRERCRVVGEPRASRW